MGDLFGRTAAFSADSPGLLDTHKQTPTRLTILDPPAPSDTLAILLLWPKICLLKREMWFAGRRRRLQLLGFFLLASETIELFSQVLLLYVWAEERWVGPLGGRSAVGQQGASFSPQGL